MLELQKKLLRVDDVYKIAKSIFGIFELCLFLTLKQKNFLKI